MGNGKLFEFMTKMCSEMQSNQEVEIRVIKGDQKRNIK